MMLDKDEEEDIEELILGYSKGLGKTLAEPTSNNPEDIRKQLDEELEYIKAFVFWALKEIEEQRKLYPELEAATKAATANVRDTNNSIFDDWVEGEQIQFIKEYHKRNIKRLMKGLPAEIIDRPPPRRVSKGTQSEKAGKLFYDKCSFTPEAYYKDLHTSNKEEGFTTETEVVYDVFEDDSHRLLKVYDKNGIVHLVTRSQHTIGMMRSPTGPKIFYKKCKFIPSHDYQTLRTKDMHKDFGFDSDSKVLWDIHKDQSVTLSIVFDIDSKAVQVVGPKVLITGKKAATGVNTEMEDAVKG
ncbi:MAG: hypothetical protein FRX48_05231 [Lasallia pustulata]|uniref:Uncharacterized protein n=1 Tax=Lasallia pustulata TaxID=136370 RepID=A0A5M8PN07_9LECA|nr:MAG: hypothetical protein FRX48_05231 [Lasallia pustulata]